MSDSETPPPPLNDAPTEEASPLPSSSLSATAQTLGSSIQAMQQALVGNLHQAAQMTLSMNLMMEELVKRAIQITVHATATAPCFACSLRITVRNRSPIPLVQMATELHFAPSNGAKTGGFTAECERERERKDGDGDGDGELGIMGEQVDKDQVVMRGVRLRPLASGEAAHAIVRLGAHVPARIRGRISVAFTSPGTGKPLSVQHAFGIRALQLIDCHFLAANNTDSSTAMVALDSMEPVHVDIARVREVFAVPPALGVAAGCLLMLGTAGGLGLVVRSVSADSRSAECHWVGTAAATSSPLFPLIPTLTHELSFQKNAQDIL
ncbi:hypothetical protein BX661DRAFT_169935 [Kickxella alabastrina]|uniref:uncharacterized protein n=1 Tax=Kickxella alabastrina TaxID=61397 RepID=UPI002220F793|nr:uncharacterized protein BX661DRAFT_169935 [Kickxella alabastrina]KAI7832114.1 hypothetical protein BX661DRAFT_169935 [Kickxella alabastrina]KAJ1946763.1 hypothetical protein GGF37_000944 [Kickxella alabastrina]